MACHHVGRRLLDWLEGFDDRVANRDKKSTRSTIMPTYEYQCVVCKKVTEVFHSMTANKPIIVCENCGSYDFKKLIGKGAGIIFHGQDKRIHRMAKH